MKSCHFGLTLEQPFFCSTQGQKELFFDANQAVAVPKEVIPEQDQQENESRRWVKHACDSIELVESRAKLI